MGLCLAEDWFAGQRALWEQRLDRLGQVLADDLAAEQTAEPPIASPPPRGACK
jgi:hypothetical protein